MSDERMLEIPAQEAAPDSTPVEIGYCRTCGYDMRGLGTEVCPECGTQFDAEETRHFNRRWCFDWLRKGRIAHLVTAAACANAVLFLLTGGLGLPAMAYVGFAGIILIAIYAAVWLPSRLQAMRSQADATGMVRCGNTVAVAAIVMLGLPVAAMSGWIGVVMALVAGLFLMALQAHRFLDGRRWGFLFGIPEKLRESVEFDVGISKFFGAVTLILLAAVLAAR